MVIVKVTERGLSYPTIYRCEYAKIENTAHFLIMEKVTMVDECEKNINQFIIPVDVIRHVSFEIEE